MRWKIPACVLVLLALVLPAPAAVAQTRSATTACEAVTHKDIRTLFVIDLDTASDLEVRLLANQVDSVARAESLTGLDTALQDLLRTGTPEEIRAFLRGSWQVRWTIDLRVRVNQTMSDPAAGAQVRAAAQVALDDGRLDTFLTYLNHGWYVARALDAGWSLQVYRDIRALFVIDLDTASDLEVRLLANQVDSVARAESLTGLHSALQDLLRTGTPEEIRAFLRGGWQVRWTIDLRVRVNQTMSDPAASARVRAAAQDALDDGRVDTFLTYLNHGLYVARAACESRST